MHAKTRVSKAARKTLLAMLKNGAMTVRQLILMIEGEKTRNPPLDLFGRIRSTRMNSYFRTLRNLKRDGLVTMKCYVRFSRYVPYHKKRLIHTFERNGKLYGCYLDKRPHDFSSIYGLTSKGRQVASEYRRELKKLTEEWRPFL